MTTKPTGNNRIAVLRLMIQDNERTIAELKATNNRLENEIYTLEHPGWDAKSTDVEQVMNAFVAQTLPPKPEKRKRGK